MSDWTPPPLDLGDGRRLESDHRDIVERPSGRWLATPDKLLAAVSGVPRARALLTAWASLHQRCTDAETLVRRVLDELPPYHVQDLCSAVSSVAASCDTDHRLADLCELLCDELAAGPTPVARDALHAALDEVSLRRWRRRQGAG